MVEKLSFRKEKVYLEYKKKSMHAEFAVMLYNMEPKENRIDPAKVAEIFKEAVDIEIEFITESIPCALLGMNAELMSEYIKYVGDRLLVQLGYDKLYNATNPFSFMSRIAMENKTNYFESRPSDYSRAKVGKTNVYEFSVEEDF